MVKKIILLTIFIIGSATLFGDFFIKGYPIVFRSSEIAIVEPNDDPVLNPLATHKPDDGDWTVYLIIDRDDFERLPSELEPYKVWKTNSVSVLEEIRSTWNFKPTGGDMATVTSVVVVVHDGKIVFESGIVLNENLIGLQNKYSGWAEALEKERVAATLEKFRKVRTPFIFI